MATTSILIQSRCSLQKDHQGAIGISAPGTGNTLNCGPYSTEAEAQEAIRKLISGVDPSTIV